MYQKILVPVDGSTTALRGLHEAIGLARATGARLWLLFVVDAFALAADVTSSDSFELVRGQLRKYGADALAAAKSLATDHGVRADTVLGEVTHGRVATVVLEQARELGCDLIVMGTHGRRGLSHLMLGSDAEMVVRTSTLPVLLVREPASS